MPASPDRSRRVATENWLSRTKRRSVPRQPRACGGVRAGLLSCRAKSRHLSLNSRDLIRSLPVRSTFGLPVYLAASQAAPFSTALRSARNDNHVDSITPKHGAHRRAIGTRDFQRQRRKIVNAWSDVAEIK